MDVKRVGQVSITIKVDLFDVAAFERVAETIATLVAQLNAVLQPQVVVEYGPAKGGRPRLTDQEWEERFAVVEKIISAKESLGITLKQACAREAVLYDTFLYWKRKFQQAKKDN